MYRYGTKYSSCFLSLVAAVVFFRTIASCRADAVTGRKNPDRNLPKTKGTEIAFNI